MVRARDLRLFPYTDGNQMLPTEVRECPLMYTSWESPSETIPIYS